MQWNNRLRVLCIFIGLLSFVNAWSQDGDALIQRIYNQSWSNNARGYNAPYIDEVNIRTETRDWFLTKQRYALRVSPYSMRERKRANRLYQHWQSELRLVKDKFIADQAKAMHERYIKLYFDQLKQKSIEKEIILVEDLIKVHTTLAENDPEKLLAVFDLKENLLKLQSQNMRLNKGIAEEYQYLFGAESVLPLALDIDSYLTAMNQVAVTPSIAQLTFSDSYNINEIDLKIDNEIAEESRILDFVQLQYTGPHREPWQEKWSLGMAANLPFFNTKKLSVAKLRVEREKETLRNELDLAERQQKIDAAARSIRSSILEYNEQERIQNAYKKEKDLLISRLMDNQLVSPILSLQEQQKSLIKDRERQLLLERLLILYVEYLDETQRYALPLTHIVKAP